VREKRPFGSSIFFFWPRIARQRRGWMMDDGIQSCPTPKERVSCFRFRTFFFSHYPPIFIHLKHFRVISQKNSLARLSDRVITVVPLLFPPSLASSLLMRSSPWSSRGMHTLLRTHAASPLLGPFHLAHVRAKLGLHMLSLATTSNF
jgi:hypothetical protein